MKTLTRPRLAVLVFAALALPALTCGVAPALRDLMQRTERLEAFLATVQLPPVLVDSAGNTVGPVLEFNRLFLYSSVDQFRRTSAYWDLHDRGAAPPGGAALATVLFTPPGRDEPVALDASPHELLALEHGLPQVLYFETPDCSGIAWAYDYQGYDSPDGSVIPRIRIAAPGRTLYVEDLGALGRSINRRSHLFAVGFGEDVGIGEGRESTCFSVGAGQPFGDGLRPLVPVADLDALFTPPFRLLAQGPMVPTP
jgi:hypothetical protein